MTAPRAPVHFVIRRDGRSWTLCSDAPAALPTGGAVIAGLSLADARVQRDTLRKHGRAVSCPELDEFDKEETK